MGAPPALFIKTSIDFDKPLICFTASSKESIFLISHSTNTALLPLA